MGQLKYKNSFELSLHQDSLDEPLYWHKPHTIFICSMSDIFHEKVPFSFIDNIMETIRKTPHHKYQALTKRAERMREYFNTREIPSNLWLGVTVEAKTSKSRIDVLRQLQAPIRFLSCEPLLEDLGDINLKNIDWVIVGGESGLKARPMKKEWVLSIANQTKLQRSAFFFKQWGTWGSDGVKRNKRLNGKLLDGKIYRDFPQEIMI
jgi:protein gp37